MEVTIEESTTMEILSFARNTIARNAMVLFTILMFETALAPFAMAAERGPTGGPAGGGFQSNHISGFDRPLERVPALPPPTFNQSTPYTAPQSPEISVSPASPGSVFGDH
jgi:hypothetical protein